MPDSFDEPFLPSRCSDENELPRTRGQKRNEGQSRVTSTLETSGENSFAFFAHSEDRKNTFARKIYFCLLLEEASGECYLFIALRHLVISPDLESAVSFYVTYANRRRDRTEVETETKRRMIYVLHEPLIEREYEMQSSKGFLSRFRHRLNEC